MLNINLKKRNFHFADVTIKISRQKIRSKTDSFSKTKPFRYNIELSATHNRHLEGLYLLFYFLFIFKHLFFFYYFQ